MATYPGPFDCFMIERAPLRRLWLRRYRSGSTMEGCPANAGYGYHNAQALQGDFEAPVPDGPNEPYVGEAFRAAFPRDCGKWPVKCDHCDYAFAAGDEWQPFDWRLWKAVGEPLEHAKATGRLWVLHDTLPDRAPSGAMFYEDWHTNAEGVPWWPGPDGKTLAVMTPVGTWTIDGPDKDGKRCWTRSGSPPNVTVTPSIRFGGFDNVPERYHGWVTAGRLIPC